jgi:hypothetical protein
MAWKGKVAQKVGDQDAGQFRLAIDYYDTAAPGVMIVRRDVVVPASATLAEIQILVRATGVLERAKFNDLAGLDGRIAVGDEVTV